MSRKILLMVVCAGVSSFMMGCFDSFRLAESSFGKMDDNKAKASPASVISMGRDDDDGKALKWHIGGKLE